LYFANFSFGAERQNAKVSCRNHTILTAGF